MGKSKDRKEKDNLEQVDIDVAPRKEKKRKRDVEETEVSTSKKSKSKSKSDEPNNVASEDASMEDAPIDDTKKSKKRKSSGVETPATSDEGKEEKKSKKDKKDKKDKKAKKSKDQSDDIAQENGTSTSHDAAPAKDDMLGDFIAFEDDTSGKFEDPAPKKRNKIPIEEKRAAKAARKAAEKEAKEAEKAEKAARREARKAEKKAAAAPAETAEEVPEEQENGTTEDTTDPVTGGKKDRFIVFVGNLPFTATKEQIQTHFAKVEPIEIRLMTEKDTQKPKGFAFIEFDRFDRMETCLKKYQHSVFADGKKGRKINVELTAGGGGNTSARLEKIQAKNTKLQDERQRDREKRDEIETKQAERKEKKQSRNKKDEAEEAVEGSSDEPAEENGGIHPARLAMMAQPEQKDWQQGGSGGFNRSQRGGQRGGRGGGRGRGRGGSRGRGKRY